MTNIVLCRDNSQATHIVEFTTIFGNRFSVLTDTPNDIQAVLDAAEEYIWAHRMTNDVPGYIADASGMPEDEIIQIGCEGVLRTVSVMTSMPGPCLERMFWTM